MSVYVPEPFAWSKVLFLASKGGIRDVPCLFGMPAAQVDMVEIPRGAVFDITLPRAALRSRLSRVARRFWSRSNKVLADELRHAGEELYERDRFLRALFESAGDAIFVLDQDEQVLDANRCACDELGYRHHELVGRAWSSFTTLNAALALNERKPDQRFVSEGVQQRRDGTTFPIEARAVLTRAEGKAVCIAVVRDVSARQKAEELQRQLLERTMVAVERERQSLARELHDSTGQSLTSVLLGLTTLEGRLASQGEAAVTPDTRIHFEALRSVVRQSLIDIERIVRGLRPYLLDELGLVSALERLAEDCAQTYQISAEVQAVGFDNQPELDNRINEALYRVAQESITNAVRHGRAHSVNLLAARQTSSVRLVIEDDGCGFDPKEVGAGHYGLVGMRERVATLGGQLTIESTVGRGTSIVVGVPLP
jgi:PAS domain S-box-containing protein